MMDHSLVHSESIDLWTSFSLKLKLKCLVVIVEAQTNRAMQKRHFLAGDVNEQKP